MLLLYSIIYTIAFLLLTPMFLLRREKYASGFSQRLGNYPEFTRDGRPVIWLHCVSVGETNAARPLVDKLRTELPDHRLVISTTTKTGNDLALNLFGKVADAIVYFPFDWKFSVGRALDRYRPSIVLLMETEIWPRLIREATMSGAKVAIVNGRLSRRSFERYSLVKTFVRRVLADVHLALMQTDGDANRIIDLGIDPAKVSVTGNLKFEQSSSESDLALTELFRSRFGISSSKPLIIAASTHEPEEKYVIDSLKGMLGESCRLMLVPRHPERFDAVGKLLAESGYSFARRSASPTDADRSADIILLDTIGELRAAYPLAEIVFVGGSLIPHGGQSILEPAAAGRSIVTGPYTHNFEAVVKEFVEYDAIRQIPPVSEDEIAKRLNEEFRSLLSNEDARETLGAKADAIMRGSNRHAAARIVELLRR